MIIKLFFLILYIERIFLKSITNSTENYRTNEKNLNVLCDCSTSFIKSRVVNGTAVPINEYRWVIAFFDSVQLHPICTGSLLSKNTVLTAAHCFDFDTNINKLFVLAGYTNDTFLMYRNVHNHRKIKKIYIHPKYRNVSGPPNKYDVAIVILVEDFVLGSKYNIFPVCILNREIIDPDDYTYHYTGYGLIKSFDFYEDTGHITDQTYAKNLNYLELNYNKIVCMDEWALWFICMSNPQASICHVDSGGPVHIVLEGSVYQIGILVHGYSMRKPTGVTWNCYPGFPSVSNKVTNFLCWIKTVGKPLCMIDN